MRSLNCLSEAPIGSIVQFNYQGGSQYGAVRKVEVTSYTTNGICGKDYDRGLAYRTFEDSKARNVRIVTEVAVTPKAATRLTTQTVHFTVARQELIANINRLTADQLAVQYAALANGINPNFDANTGNVAYDVPAKTFMVNGMEMTVAEMAELVKNNS